MTEAGNPEAIQRLWEKLDRFAADLPAEEAEVLGELLLPALATGSESGSPIGSAIGRAMAGGKALTRIYVNDTPEGVVLAAAGPVGGGKVFDR
jgi:hypothetical protein